MSVIVAPYSYHRVAHLEILGFDYRTDAQMVGDRYHVTFSLPHEGYARLMHYRLIRSLRQVFELDFDGEEWYISGFCTTHEELWHAISVYTNGLECLDYSVDEEDPDAIEEAREYIFDEEELNAGDIDVNPVVDVNPEESVARRRTHRHRRAHQWRRDDGRRFI